MDLQWNGPGFPGYHTSPHTPGFQWEMYRRRWVQDVCWGYVKPFPYLLQPQRPLLCSPLSSLSGSISSQARAGLGNFPAH